MRLPSHVGTGVLDGPKITLTLQRIFSGRHRTVEDAGPYKGIGISTAPSNPNLNIPRIVIPAIPVAYPSHTYQKGND